LLGHHAELLDGAYARGCKTLDLKQAKTDIYIICAIICAILEKGRKKYITVLLIDIQIKCNPHMLLSH
jgi:hypothetical protein